MKILIYSDFPLAYYGFELDTEALALDGQCLLDLLTTAPGIEAVQILRARMEWGMYT
ncbi:hypothetical protein [Rhodoferax sp.]|uniref:hypothetical protein n=1 Tax=Rhodoferax sp. TaxID=50421 RepID=UPI001ED4A024|nr:hypothetical protein [Rhodoferax sp.]MBT9508195.1 hypothetical protein [Rhodoferax sp.]